MSADLAALADEALYAEQWLLQGQPVGSLTPGASKMRDIEAALRTLAAADEKMPVAGWTLKPHAVDCAQLDPDCGPCTCFRRKESVVKQADAQAAVLAAVAAERARIEREVSALTATLSGWELHNAILRAIRGGALPEPPPAAPGGQAEARGADGQGD